MIEKGKRKIAFVDVEVTFESVKRNLIGELGLSAGVSDRDILEESAKVMKAFQTLSEKAVKARPNVLDPNTLSGWEKKLFLMTSEGRTVIVGLIGEYKDRRKKR